MLEHGGKSYRLALPLIGAYQASNVLTAAGLVLATGGDWDSTFSAMQRVAPVRGRLERAVISRAGVPVYIDYAHTPDALEAAIAALRPHVEGRADHRVRRGRRPRPGQKAADGRGRDALVRLCDRHRRQSAQRGSGGDPVCDHGRRAGRDRGSGPPRSDRRSDPHRPGRATSCSSPARGTKRGRSSATGCFRSTTRWSRGSARHEEHSHHSPLPLAGGEEPRSGEGVGPAECRSRTTGPPPSPSRKREGER